MEEQIPLKPLGDDTTKLPQGATRGKKTKKQKHNFKGRLMMAMVKKRKQAGKSPVPTGSAVPMAVPPSKVPLTPREVFDEAVLVGFDVQWHDLVLALPDEVKQRIPEKHGKQAFTMRGVEGTSSISCSLSHCYFRCDVAAEPGKTRSTSFKRGDVETAWQAVKAAASWT